MPTFLLGKRGTIGSSFRIYTGYSFAFLFVMITLIDLLDTAFFIRQFITYGTRALKYFSMQFEKQ